VTDVSDVSLLLNHYGQTVDGGGVAVPAEERAALDVFAMSVGVPEPGTMSVGAAMALLMLGARRRRPDRISVQTGCCL
jgi:hypothetical protein